MKLQKIYQRLFRKTGVTGPTIQLSTEDAAYEARVIEWEHKTERLLELAVVPECWDTSRNTATLKFTSAEAGRLGDLLLGYAKAYEEFDWGRDAGWKESYEARKKND